MSVRWPLASLNLIGGVAVLSSYVLAFAYAPAVREGLWGGLPEDLRPLYTANMLLAALGYFPFTALFVFGEAAHPGAREPGHPRYLLIAYALVLIPSALWVPLTAWVIASPSLLLWYGVRLDLFLVAVGAAMILAETFQHARAKRSVVGTLPLAGAIPFFVQTGILDALIWPAFYPI